MSHRNQGDEHDDSKSDSDEYADLEKDFEAFTTAFLNRKIYTELNEKIIRGIPDEHLTQAIVDFVGVRIEQDWEHDVARVPPLGLGFSAVYFLTLLETEVNNGGFNQMFYNNGRESVIHAREGAELVGLAGLASVIARALEVEKSVRGKLASANESGTIEAFMASYEDADFESVDDDYSDLADKIEGALIRFIRDNSEMFSGKVNG